MSNTVNRRPPPLAPRISFYSLITRNILFFPDVMRGTRWQLLLGWPVGSLAANPYLIHTDRGGYYGADNGAKYS